MTETTDLQRLIVSLDADIKKYERQLARAQGVALDATRQVERNFDKMTAGVTSGLSRIATMAVSVFSLGALLAFSKKAIDAADRIAESAERIGITTKSLQELSFAAKLSGVEAEALEQVMLQLQKRIGGAQDDVDETAKALGKLGISLADIKGKKPDEVFKLIADRIALVKDPMQQARIATDLFGRTGQQLLPILKSGSAGLAALAAEAHKLGLVLSEETLKKAGQAADEYDKLSLAFRAAGVNISVGLLPGLIELRKVMTDPAFQDGVKSIAEGFSNVIKFLVDNKDVVVAAAAAFAAFKTAAIATRGLGGTASLGAGVVAGGIAFVETMKAMRSEIEKVKEALADLDASDKRLRDTAKKAAEVGANETVLQQGKLLLANEAKRVELNKQLTDLLEKQKRVRVDVAVPTQPQGPPAAIVDPEVTKALEDATFKARVARGEFDTLAEGFPELVRGFTLSRDAIINFGGSVSSLSPQLQELNTRMRDLQAANDLKKGAEDFGKAFGKAFEDAVLRAKDFRDVLKALGDEIARIILRLLITNQLERTLKSSFSSLFGGGGLFGLIGSVAGVAGGAPKIPAVSASGAGRSGPSFMIVNNINAPGADPAGLLRVERGLAELNRTLPQRVGAIARDRQVRNIRM